MNIFTDRINPLFQKSGLPDKALEENIGLPRGIIYKWKNNKNKNYKFYLVDIAAYFHVSTDYLLGNTDDPAPPGGKEGPAPDTVGGPVYPLEYDFLSPEDKELVDNMIRSLAKKKSSG